MNEEKKTVDDLIAELSALSPNVRSRPVKVAFNYDTGSRRPEVYVAHDYVFIA